MDRRWWRRWLAHGAAAVQLLLVLGCADADGAGEGAAAEAAFRREIAADHAIYQHETRHLVEVPAEEVEHLRMWLGDRLNGDFAVPDLADLGLRFAGGRMLALAGRPVAQLMYERAHGLPIALCITAMEGGPSPVTAERRGALGVASWRDAGYAYVVVGEASDALLRAVAARAAPR
jgi:anti-sigma factor RsiW